MSRYTYHKHGMVIGYATQYFIFDNWRDDSVLVEDPKPPVLPEGVPYHRDGYGAIVSFGGYEFEQVHSWNYYLRTPAQQIVWKMNVHAWTSNIKLSNGTVLENVPFKTEYFTPNYFIERWLEENVGPKYKMWDTYTWNRRTQESLFFKRRKDGLAFIREVCRLINGIKIKKKF